MDKSEIIPDTFRKTLTRAGWALIIIGVLDIGLMIWAITNRVSYSSSFNLFALVGGILMLRGNLTAAEFWRFVATFIAAMLATLMLTTIAGLMVPVGLILAEMKQNPGLVGGGAAMGTVVLGTTAWIAHELNSPVMREARRAAGRKVRSIATPIALGMGMPILMAVGMSMLQSSEAGKAGVAQVSAKHGDSYRYYIQRIQYSSDGAFGCVVFWNNRELRAEAFDLADPESAKGVNCSGNGQ